MVQTKCNFLICGKKLPHLSTSSYLFRNDPLAQQLGPVYGLTPEAHAVVGVSMGEGEVHIFPQGNSTRASLKAWLTALREGHSTPSGNLISGSWFVVGGFIEVPKRLHI